MIIFSTNSTILLLREFLYTKSGHNLLQILTQFIFVCLVAKFLISWVMSTWFWKPVRIVTAIESL